VAHAGRIFSRHGLPIVSSVAQLSTALLLELQRTPEGCRFDVGCGELASEVVDLVLGGEELIRHESRCFGKIVVRESHADTDADGQ
jgi:hypothetical protein